MMILLGRTNHTQETNHMTFRRSTRQAADQDRIARQQQTKTLILANQARVAATVR